MASRKNFELAVAVPVKNKNFSYGTYGKAFLNEPITKDGLISSINVTEDEINTLSDILQNNDSIMIGPSTNSDHKGEMEVVPVCGVKNNLNDTDLLLQNAFTMENSFSAGDQITFKGRGLAGGWRLNRNGTYNSVPHFSARGINTGFVSKNKITSYIEGSSSNPGEFGVTGTLVAFKRPSADLNCFLLKVLHDKFNYVKDPLDSSNLMKAVMDTGFSADTLSILYGDYHRGGWRKETAQKITVNPSTSMSDTLFFYQELLENNDSTKTKRFKNPLIPFQHYRIGGRVFIETSNHAYDSAYKLGLRLNPHNEYQNADECIIMSDIFSGNPAFDCWYEFNKVGMLKSGLSKSSNATFGLFFDKLTVTNNSEINMFIDELYAEFGGGVEFEAEDGCLNFSRYNAWATEGSFSIKETKTDNVYAQDYKRKVISFELENTTQPFYDQLERLLEWQNKGYYLNLHCYINEVPNTLTGKFRITNIKKPHWDLTLRSLTVEFEEVQI